MTLNADATLMPLTLTLKKTTNVPLEVEGVTPDVVRNLSLTEIEKLQVFEGNRQIPLAEFFSVAGDPSDERMIWEGELQGVHWIGAKMKSGIMEVRSNAGRHVGSELRGGEIHVYGAVSDWVGGELHNGLIHVRGSAGHLVGAGYRGSAKGMTGGVLLIEGNAGNEIGHTMRRGLIAIGGTAGDLVGFNMLAGTILIFGESGIRHGAGMKRGSIGFFSDNKPPLLPTFRFACRYQPDFMTLVWNELRERRFPFPSEFRSASYDLYHGDMIEGGRGEVLFRA